MNKITPTTTLGELAILRAQYGITRISINIDFLMIQPVLATIYAHEIQAIGRGETEAEALDDALARLIHRVGEVFTEDLAQDEAG